ncbi:MAG TPA: DUF3102 domain-containing protein [Mycobacterium sp.]|nr:DUF3102 domain-containing protein [Mycobacterium sp.]
MTGGVVPLTANGVGRPADEDFDEVIEEADLPELAAVANRFHQQFEDHVRSAVECAWYAGRALNTAKVLFRRGEWLPWLEANFRGSRQTAERYMALARNCSCVSNLDPDQSITAALKAIPTKKPGPGGDGKPKPAKDYDHLDEADNYEDDEHRRPIPDALFNRAVDMTGMSEQEVAGIRQLAGDLNGPEAVQSRAVTDLRGESGFIPTTITDLITAEMGPPTDQMAGLLAAALASKFGSWSAFEEAHREYEAAAKAVRG